MSIENLLTLGVAAAILVAAAVLRLIVLGSMRLFFKLSGKPAPWARSAETAERGPSRTRPRRPLARPALNGLGALGAGLLYVFATLGTSMRSAGTKVARAAATAHVSLSPRVASGTQRGAAAAGRTMKAGAIVTVASGQHLGRLAARRIKEAAERRAARPAPPSAQEEAPTARVIVLDREWDPLTDPLEDQPVSNYR
jgi:hypothetical protein